MTAHHLYTRTLSGGVTTPKAHALAFYGKGNIATHVGYCISDTHIVEAAGGGVLTTTVEAAIKQKAYIRIRPVFYRKDFLAIHVPCETHFS